MCYKTREFKREICELRTCDIFDHYICRPGKTELNSTEISTRRMYKKLDGHCHYSFIEKFRGVSLIFFSMARF